MKKTERTHKEVRLDTHEKARDNINNTNAEKKRDMGITQQTNKILMRGES